MSNSINLFDPVTDPEIAAHRERLKKVALRLVRPVREGLPVKVKKLGFSYTLQQGDFDEMEERIAQGIKELDWRDLEELDKFVEQCYQK